MWQKFLLLIPVGVFAAQINAPDRWLEGDDLHSRFMGRERIETRSRSTVHAEAVADELQILWTSS